MTFQFAQVPGSAASNLYMDGLQCTYVSTTSVSFAAGACRDSSNTFDLVLSSATTLDLTTNGLNGLDQGALAASSDYAVYAIYSEQFNNQINVGGGTSTAYPTGFIASLNLTGTPLLPAFYNTGGGFLRLVKYLKTNGSSQIIPFVDSGNHTERTNTWPTAISVAPGGLTTGYVLQSFAAGMPPISTTVYLNGTFVPDTAGDFMTIAPGNTIAAPDYFLVGGATAPATNKFGPSPFLVPLVSSVPSVYIKSTSASDTTTLLVSAYTVSL